jgi:arylsulfatase A-like enzyme
MDLQFGRLLQTLKDLGVYDDTVIIVVADHGEGLGNHDQWFHRILYQEQIRVPLIMRLPGGPGGRVVPELVSTTDIYPTVLEALNIEPPSKVDGRSMQGLIDSQPEEARIAYADALILYDLNAKDLLKRRPNDDLLHCVMDRSWKLIYKPSNPEQSELYNLAADPGEMENLYTEDHPEVGRLFAALEEMDAWVNEPFGEGDDRDVLDRLEALGYVGGSDDDEEE